MKRRNEPFDVLVIEDHPDELKLIRRALRGKCKVHVCVDGEEAVWFLSKRGDFEGAPAPDLVITCLNLPKVNGHEILSRIKQTDYLRRVPVVVLSTSCRSEDVNRAYDSRAAGYFVKPSDRDEFLRVVDMIREYWMGIRWRNPSLYKALR